MPFVENFVDAFVDAFVDTFSFRQRPRRGSRRRLQITALRHVFALAGAVWGLSGMVLRGAEETPEATMPPAASVTVEFARDIQPILEAHCLKCHGPEKPKSSFRLDQRALALKGGDNGVAILPRDSTNSPLIRMVSGMEPDLEMPPKGKGEPLTAEQIGLLRAWIDQGLVWPEPEPEPASQLTLSPLLGWFFVDGDQARFREHHWVRDGAQGGLEHFRVSEKLEDGSVSSVEGRLLRDDYQVRLEWRRPNAAFLRGGFEKYRRYYDDSGGYYAGFTNAPSQFELDRDLYLDIGKGWVEGGIEIPGLPQVVVGYEYHFREGDKSTLQWRSVSQSFTEIRNYRPNTKHVDEHRHVLRADVRDTTVGVDWEDRFRMEFYDVETARTGALPFPRNSQAVDVPIEEGTDYRQLANSFTAEKQVLEWMLVSAGYLYTDLSGEASFRQMSTSAGVPALGLYWSGDDITLDQHSQTANFNAQLGPWEGLVFFAGVQPEWSEQESFGQVRLDEGLPPLTGAEVRPAVIEGNWDRILVEEQAGVRFTRIPRSVLYAEARLRQESIAQFERKDGTSVLTYQDYVRDTDATGLLEDYRGGIEVSPWQWLSFGGHYRKRFKDNDYDHDRDEEPIGVSPGVGYSAFITGLDTDTDEIEGRCVIKPASWLKTTLTARWEATDYETETDAIASFTPGGRVSNAGEQDGWTYGLGVVLTPLRRVYLSLSGTYSDLEVRTYDSGSLSIVPYEGNLYSGIAAATVVFDPKTDLTASYFYSHGDYEQDNEAFGLPVGIRYSQHGLLAGLKRRFTENVSGKLQYGFFQYDEPSSGGFNDYSAHGVFGSMTFLFK